MSLVYKEVFEDGYPVECEWAMEADSADLHKMRDQLRALADALEEVERLKGLLAAAAKELPHCSGPVHERIAVYRREHAKQIEQAERRAERLKFHAEAMAKYLTIDGQSCRPEDECAVCAMLSAYRDEFPESAKR